MSSPILNKATIVLLAIGTAACTSVQAVNQNNASTASTATVIDTTSLTTYNLDPHHSNVRFAINHMNTSTMTGGFYELTGTVKYSAKAQTGYVKINIPMESMHTISKQFTEHLKGKDFFDTTTYPTATFESNKWYFDNKTHPEKVTQIDGNLTLHGITQPITLTATSFNCYFNPIAKKTACGGDFTTTIDRTKWKIDKYVLLGIPKEVKLDIEIEALKQ